jgi:hypothetical protein
MAVALRERRVAVGRLRIRSRGGDDLRLRLRVDRVLGGAEILPGRLPQAAILVVRSLTDPLPGRLDPRAAAPSQDWERAVAAALDDRVARAARPASGVVPADADAVVFADRADLLACLARDWCAGALGTRWWWRTLTLAEPPEVFRAFAHTPEAVPAAIERLARTGAALAFAMRVPPPVASTLIRAIASGVGADPAAEAALTEPEEVRAVARDHGADSPRPGRPGTPAPWRQWFDPAEAAALAPEQEAFIGLALAARRAPSAIRAPGFAAAARAWRAGRSVQGDETADDERAAGPDLPLSFAPAVETIHPGVGRERPPTPRLRTPGFRDVPRALRPEVAAPRRSTAPFPPTREPIAVARPARKAVAAVGEDDLELTSDEPLAAVVETRLAGLFHLVLIGQRLGFYGDFATPAQPGIALDVWDFVTLVGRRLLVRPPRDPVWTLLAQLAGRPQRRRPGTGFRPPRAWRLPRTALEPFGHEGTWRYAESDGRFLLIHPRGFGVVDAAAADLDRELTRYGVRRASATTKPSVARTELDRWADNVTGYVRARLALALGLPAREAVRLALRRPARIFVAETRIDVVSRLADLPLEVRRAGLDRDAGYVPAAGRILAFHFE